jgi:hypothetical protein
MQRHIANSCKFVGQVDLARAAAAESRANALEAALAAQTKQATEQAEKLRALELKVERVLAAGASRKAAATSGNTTVVQGDLVNHTRVSVDVNVVVNMFGQEDLGHLGRTQTSRLLLAGETVADGIRALGTAIWCDPTLQKNYTVERPNVKDSRLNLRGAGGRWEIHGRKEGYIKMHRHLTNHAYDNQPMDCEQARAVAPRLRELDEIDKGSKEFPVGAYDAIAIEARVHRGQ